ncbi:manganese-binding transcriptional regulator MntR [Gimesia fumaroli]|uniref:Transcriptional regulator MntR n=1 Tax=Gimesia fumaroli TaxID=2527976 RepID=A0A518IJR1_9PLAN|nr:manganese-binding transcriptional regulator MntR [Gimesia fumaroli]QDV53328.1 Transcriptional regulator MntR [Gimesia fumaroli]
MAKKKPKNQHERTRVDHATEIAEDYVEAIAEIIEEQDVCRVKDLAEYFAVSHVTVNRTVARLQRDGYATTEPYSPVELTSKGAKLAKHSRHRHEIVLSFLVALGVSEEIAATDTEGIEHHVSPETLKVMEAFISKAHR